MIVNGPTGWESTARLQAALADVETDQVLQYGVGVRKDGVAQLLTFQESGIPCPTFTTDRIQAMIWVREGKQVFGRRLLHSQGSDIIGPGYQRKMGGERWNRRWLAADYWVQFIPSSREYRQHIFNGRAIRLGEKEMTTEPWRRYVVRSRGNGWTIRYPPRTPAPEGVRVIAKLAAKAVGYLMGAVDILEGEDGSLYVLEINAAPSVRDNGTLEAYVKGIKRWISRRLQQG